MKTSGRKAENRQPTVVGLISETIKSDAKVDRVVRLIWNSTLAALVAGGALMVLSATFSVLPAALPLHHGLLLAGSGAGGASLLRLWSRRRHRKQGK